MNSLNQATHLGRSYGAKPQGYLDLPSRRNFYSGIALRRVVFTIPSLVCGDEFRQGLISIRDRIFNRSGDTSALGRPHLLPEIQIFEIFVGLECQLARLALQQENCQVVASALLFCSNDIETDV